MRILGSVAKWLFMLCLPLLLLTASIGWAVNSLWLYEYGFHRYSIKQTPELAEFDLEEIARGLISYFNSGDEHINFIVVKDNKQIELFTPEEVIHFRDVKGLVWLDYWVLFGTLLYNLSYAGISLFWHKRRYWRRLAWGVVGGSGITLALMLALGVGTLLDFDRLFYQFHLLFFSNWFWSVEGYMVLLFPADFWYDALLFCALATVVGAVVLGGVGSGYLFSKRKRVAL